MIEIAMDDEKRKRAMQGVKPAIEAPQAPAKEKGLGDQAQEMILSNLIDQGITNTFMAGAGTPAVAGTATTAAAPAVAGGIGPAAAAAGPYAAAALAAAYLLPKLFSHGGQVKGPLYAEEGTKEPVVNRMTRGMKADNTFAGPISKIKYKAAGGEITEVNYGMK